MAQALKVLGQVNPSATTLTAMYTVPGSTTATISTVTICNQAGADGSFRLSVAVAGAADNAKQYISYDAPIAANDTVTMTLGLTLGAADVLRVYASSGSMSFNAFGVELT